MGTSELTFAQRFPKVVACPLHNFARSIAWALHGRCAGQPLSLNQALKFEKGRTKKSRPSSELVVVASSQQGMGRRNEVVLCLCGW